MHHTSQLPALPSNPIRTSSAKHVMDTTSNQADDEIKKIKMSDAVPHSEPIAIARSGPGQLGERSDSVMSLETATVMNSPLMPQFPQTTQSFTKTRLGTSPLRTGTRSVSTHVFSIPVQPQSPKQTDSEGENNDVKRKASIVRAPSSLMSDGSFSTPGSAYFTQAMSAVANGKKKVASPLHQHSSDSRYDTIQTGRLQAKARKGRIAWEGQFYSERMKMNRTVRIYVPPSYYDLNAPLHADLQRYPVIYFHDGQNAYSSMGPDINWGWGNWSMDTTIEDLSARNRARECIVVAVDCSSDRYLDYRGPPYPYTDQEKSGLRGPPHVLSAPGNPERYEAYKHFLVDELKPRVDLMYRTLSDTENTCVMGASMGGICALALCWDRPDVFGLCASLSGAFMVEHQHFLRGIIRKARQYPTPEVSQRLHDVHGHLVQLPHPPFKVYLDSGISDYQGGDDGLKETTKVKQELIRLGWLEGRDLMHVVEGQPLTDGELEYHGLNRGKWGEAKANMHNEFYWKLRVWKPLEFLLPPLTGHAQTDVSDLEAESGHPGPIHEYEKF